MGGDAIDKIARRAAKAMYVIPTVRVCVLGIVRDVPVSQYGNRRLVGAHPTATPLASQVQCRE